MAITKLVLAPMFAVIVFPGANSAQTRWTAATLANGPGKRSEFDVARTPDNIVYLFGGRGGSGYLDDTWMFDGKVWTQIPTVTTPSPRSGYCMAYDFLRKKVVMFSGWDGGNYLADTWEFDGTDWKDVTPAAQPGPRDWSSMAFDIRTQKVILFGGHDWRRANYDDTWSWDGQAWVQIATTTTPPARTGHRMVLDQNIGAVVMVGSSNAGADLWSWTGADWLQVNSATQPGYGWMLSAAFDLYRNRLVVYHGTNTWEFDGVDWTQRLSTGGPGVNFAPAFFDGVRNEVCVFGGAIGGDRNNPSDATQCYGAVNPAIYEAFGTGCKGSSGDAPVLGGTPPWLGEFFNLYVSDLPSSGNAYFYMGLSKTSWGSIGLPFALATIGAPTCSLYTDPILLVSLVNTSGSARWTTAIPNVASTVGIPFYNQAWAVDPAANALGITVSNGTEGRVGSK